MQGGGDSRTTSGSGAYWLPPQVFVCQTPDCVVFLDARRDKYLGIGGDDAQALRAVLSAESSLETPYDADVFEGLVTHGLLTRQRSSGRPFRAVDLRQGCCAVGMGTEFDYAPQLRHVLAALRANISARFDLRFRGVAGTMERLLAAKQKSRASVAAAGTDELRRMVSIFRVIRPFLYTTNDQCLLHGLTLYKFLSRYGFSPTWVIGVRTSPFIAHCWVQHDESVLDDSPERTLEFTPVVAI